MRLRAQEVLVPSHPGRLPVRAIGRTVVNLAHVNSLSMLGTKCHISKIRVT